MPASTSRGTRSGRRSGQVQRSRKRTALLILGALAGLVLLLGVLNFYARASVAFPGAGLIWKDAAGRVVASRVDPTGPAARAGIRVGDQLVGVDGQQPASAQEAQNAVGRAEPGHPVALKVLRARRALLVTLEPDFRDVGGQLYAYLATVGLFFLASALFLLYRLGVSLVTWHYYLLSLSVFAVLVFSHTGAAGFLDGLFYGFDLAGLLLFPALMVHFVLIFPRRRPWKVRDALLYAPAVTLGAAMVWLVPLGGAERVRDPAAALGKVDALELLYVALYLAGGLAVLTIRSSRTTVLSVRRQLRWMAWGMGIGSMPFVVFYLLPRALQVQTPPAANLSALPLIVLPLAFSTAILKYRLADLGLLVKSGVTVLTLTFFSLALFVVLNLALRGTLGLPGINNRIFTVLAGVLVFFLYPNLQQIVGTVVDRAFYMGRYDYRRRLIEFGRELNSERELRPLLDKFHDRILRTFPVYTSILLLPDEARGGLRLLGESGDPGQGVGAGLFFPVDPRLRQRIETEDVIHLDRAARRLLPPGARHLDLHAFFPMRVKSRLVAVLGIGMRDVEEEMNSEDRQLLVTMAAHAASAIEGARLYEENLERIREVELLKDYNESIVESSQIGILVLDRENRIRVWNRAMEEMFGRSRQEMVALRPGDVFPDDLVAVLEGGSAGGTRLDRYPLSGRKGSPRFFNLALSDLTSKTGEQRGVVAAFDEVTEQVRMEQHLVQSERLAAVGLLASGVAHEINTPLTGISSFTELLLEETPEKEPGHAILKKIQAQSQRASRIANSLLNFSRGRREDIEKVNLNDTVEDTLAVFGPHLKGRRIEIQFEPVRAPAPVVHGHRGRLQQVLLNLLLNARDAMPGGGRIQIFTSVSGGSVQLRVVDTGHGIAPEDLHRIYDPFFSTKGPAEGTGLGLSVTYGIVRDHGGTIEADSGPGGVGTQFTVRVPAWRDVQVAV
ncbi:MAG: ATP-binding protein [Acidobacteriota bacterium]